MNAFGANTAPLTVYTISSYRHLHAVQLFQRDLRVLPHVKVLDWTQFAPPSGLPLKERRVRMLVGESCLAFAFCTNACASADLVVYLGDSGKDSAVQVCMASAVGTPVLGIAGPLEDTGLVLHNAVTQWVRDPFVALGRIRTMGRCRSLDAGERGCAHCPAAEICTLEISI